MATKNNESGGLSSNLKGSLDDQISNLRGQIADRAYELAQERTRPIPGEVSEEDTPVVVSLQDVAQAIDESLGRRSIPPQKVSFFDLFPLSTCLCFLLCIAFGTLGLVKATGAQGFLDMPKVLRVR
jgi:hypothetical protein